MLIRITSIIVVDVCYLPFLPEMLMKAVATQAEKAGIASFCIRIATRLKAPAALKQVIKTIIDDIGDVFVLAS